MGLLGWGRGYTGVCSPLGGETDQCCKVYQLHVSVTVEPAILLGIFLVWFSLSSRGWAGREGAQNLFVCLFFYTFSLYFFLFVCFCNNKKCRVVVYFFQPQQKGTFSFKLCNVLYSTLFSLWTRLVGRERGRRRAAT